MIARQQGGIAIQVLGVALLLLLIVGGLGLADAARAKALRTSAMRSLTAAVQSAARAPVADRQATFDRVLRANMAGAPYRAELHLDPLSATGRLWIEFKLEYIGRWLRPIQLEMEHTEPLLKRKPRP